ncbi:hypothetical protein [Rhizobium sp. BR 314]|uniref:hypothetical protein n=1 Tax=Rhizobium sp. BR 314 TaxID=3040013 RepID=UPI0039BF26E9
MQRRTEIDLAMRHGNPDQRIKQTFTDRRQFHRLVSIPPLCNDYPVLNDHHGADIMLVRKRFRLGQLCRRPPGFLW